MKTFRTGILLAALISTPGIAANSDLDSNERAGGEEKTTRQILSEAERQAFIERYGATEGNLVEKIKAAISEMPDFVNTRVTSK